MLKAETMQRIQELDEKYFGKRPMKRLLRALAHQVRSMEKESTVVNVRKQIGDALFVILALTRNMNWDLDELAQEVVTRLEARRKERHYYEAHVTVEPVFGKRLQQFKDVCKEHGFRVATLLMQKRKRATPKRSENDSFCTGRSISYSDLEDRMVDLVKALEQADFKVWRYKIESTILDSRYNDSMHRLDHDALPEHERKPRAPADGALPGRQT